MEAVEQALAHLDEFRTQEGAILIADLLKRIDRIEAYKQEVIPFEKCPHGSHPRPHPGEFGAVADRGR